MNHYHHLTLLEREKILFFSAKGYSLSRIAEELGRSKATISRELRRNSQKQAYMPVIAEQQYCKRRKRCRRKKRLSDPALYELVREKFLVQQWSPEQIEGRLRLENYPDPPSYKTIYRAIYAGMFDTKEQKRSEGNRGMRRWLRHRGKPRKTKNPDSRRGKMTISHSIEERPEEANSRSRFGDWEADTVQGKANGPRLVTLVDRKSRYLLCKKVATERMDEVAQAMIDCLEGYPCKSITPDRGKEFSRHGRVTEATGAEFYFALPRHPWQRGTNENTNGLLREYFPKKTSLANVSDKEVQMAEDKLNHRPRKCLGYLSPFEVLFQTPLHLT